MYDELIKRLRDAAKMSEALAVLLPHSEGNATAKLFNEAADAIEELSSIREEQKAQIIAMAAEIEEQQSSWIPVTERLPNSGVCVLITDGLEVGEGCLTEITNTRGYFMRWCAPTADIDVDRRPITHWMPLPEPPKEEAT